MRISNPQIHVVPISNPQIHVVPTAFLCTGQPELDHVDLYHVWCVTFLSACG